MKDEKYNENEGLVRVAPKRERETGEKDHKSASFQRSVSSEDGNGTHRAHGTYWERDATGGSGGVEEALMAGRSNAMTRWDEHWPKMTKTPKIPGRKLGEVGKSYIKLAEVGCESFF